MSLDFLRTVFPAETEGYVRILAGTPDDFPSVYRFLSVEQLHALEDLSEICDPRMQVYFTPHTFSKAQQPVSKPDALMCTCLWLECDDQGFDPLSISQGPPSIIIETSPGRTHSYWLLNQPIDPFAAEELNQALAYKYLSKDKGGWPLCKLLRVPGTKNMKYDPPYDVRLLTMRRDRRYSPADFDDLPKLARHMRTSSEPGDESGHHLPEEHQLPSEEEVHQKWGIQFSKTLKDLLETRQTDRSKALWRISNECCRIGLSRAETFVLVWDTPNNKFRDHRFNAREGLWADICNAYRNATTTNRQEAMARIEQVRNNRMIPPDVRREEISKLTYKTMALEGRFYYSPRTAESLYYMTEPEEQLVRLHPRDEDCMVYLQTHYNLNGTTGEFKYTAEYLRAWCEHDAPRVMLRDLAYYDMESHYLYVTDFKGGIYRMNGETIDYVENGVDGGVFFRQLDRTVPYSPNFEADPKLLDDLIFNRVNMPKDSYPQDKARFLVRSWFYSLFFSEMFETRPLLVFEGPAGSGKSVNLKCMEWVLRGLDGQVLKLPDSAKGFNEVVRERTHVFFDGVDDPFKGVSEVLSTTATGTKERVRILYTDNKSAEYNLKAFLGITTMEAHFLRADVADRSVLLRTARRDEFRAESSIKQEVLSHRNDLWGAILQECNLLVAALKYVTVPDTKLRMADFAKMIFAMCKVHEQDAEWFVRFLKQEQDVHVLRRDPVAAPLCQWLKDEKNLNRTVSAGDLHSELLQVASKHDMKYVGIIRSPQQLTARLKKLQPNLGFIKELHPLGDRYGYRFPEKISLT